MHYYIDGYNLLFRFSDQNKDFTNLREVMIRELDHQAAFLGLELTLVFDAQYQLGEASRTHYHSVEILYTAFGELADDLILSEIRTKTRPHLITVVTSDKKLAWFARRCEAKTESVEHFKAWLNRRYYNKLHKGDVKLKIPASPKKAEGEGSAVEAPLASVTPLMLPLKPVKTASVTECYGYYHEIFERRLTTYEIADKIKRTKKLEGKSSKPPKKQKLKKSIVHSQDSLDSRQDPLTEMERWLKIFET